MRRQLAQPCQRRPGEERAAETGEQTDQPTERAVLEKCPLDDETDEDGLEHQAQGRSGSDGRGWGEMAAGDGGLAGQAGIDELPQVSLRRSQLVPLSVRGDSSRVAPASGATDPVSPSAGPGAPAAGSTAPGCAGRLSRPRNTQ